ncbi:MAG: hypothetical protein HFE75_06075 [Firmicutes bacterium]|jgi:hypothetical protein|nr:hypothetical protein [Bacillota bacterium]NBI63066.1 hypothetical protein [Clostridiales bacterium]
MKRRIIAVTVALLMMITVVPVTAAADGNGQPIPVDLDVLAFEGETAQKNPVEITDQDPVVSKNYRGKIYEFTLPQPGTLVVTLSPLSGSKGTEMVFDETKDFVKADNGDWNTNRKWVTRRWSSLEDGTSTFYGNGKAYDKYYLALVNNADNFQSQKILQAAFYPATDRTLELGKTYVFGGSYDKKYQDFKFTATKSGYVSVVFSPAAENEATFSLLDQNKKRLSGQYGRSYDIGYPYPLTFGVQKGKTYYLRTAIDVPPQDARPHRIRLTNSEIKEKSGTSRKKAVSVKKNKTVKGYILPGKKTSDWYKVKVTKTRKVKFFVRNRFSDQCYFDIYNKKGKKLKTKQKISKTDGGVRSKTKYVRLTKGTYYVKVYNKTKGDSGYYDLKWK